tara:strand:+ start:66 stop:1376 length:1311 start_codon:yes stop_codon:yes gene_type:complete
MKIEQIKTSELIPYARNSRTHDERQVGQIAGSIREFGFTNPVLIDANNGIIAGHGRVLAAQTLSRDTVPCIRLDHLNEGQRKAYIIADNKLALNAGWNDELLALELTELQGLNFDLGLTGFSEEEIADLLFEEIEGETDEDEVPEAPVTPITSTGDTWTLGNHRLMCGDSTCLTAVGKLMDGSKADMVWTDPPYNVAYEGGTGMTIQNDDMSNEDFLKFLTNAFTAAYSFTKEGGPIYIAHADSEGINFRTAMIKAGWYQKQTLIWVKNALVLGRQDYQWRHEPILYGWKPGAAHCWYGYRDKDTVINDDVKIESLGKKELVEIVKTLQNEARTTVIQEDKPHRNDIHPTMKPVALVEFMVENSSQRAEIVLDLFGGGGSTMIAAEKKGRSSRLMELDPKYCDVIITRWQDFTGKEAIHEASGKTYGDLKSEQDNK